MLTLKNGSKGSAGHSTATAPRRAVQRSTRRSPSAEQPAQFVARGDRPQPDHRMPPPAGGGIGGARRLRRLAEADGEVGRQERAVGRNGEEVSSAEERRRHMVEPGEDAGKRPRRVGQAVRHHRHAEPEAFRRAVGVEQQRAHLRPDPPHDAREDGLAAERAQRLVAAAHAPRQAAGEDEPDRLVHHAVGRVSI